MKAKTRTNQPIEHLEEDVKEVVESATDGTLDKVLGLDGSGELVKGSIATETKKYIFSGYVGQGYDFSLTEDEWKSIKGIPYFITIRCHINDNPDDDEIAYIKWIGDVVCEHSMMPGLDGYTLFSSTLSDNHVMLSDQQYIGLPMTMEIYCLVNPNIVPVETNNLFQIEL